jgi:hypothetical protein
MALKAVPGFKSFVTHHCITGSMRHIYEFHDYPISEDLLLGLGSGVGFVYWHMKGLPPMLGGRANVGRPGEEGLEKTAGRRTGVLVERFDTGSSRKAERALFESLEAGEPLMVQLDMGFLPYFDLPEGFHFGWHMVVVAGRDPHTGQVLIADRDELIHPVSADAVAEARGSTFKPFPPRHAWWTFDFSGKRPPKPEEVWDAIREVTSSMLEPPIANIGVKGIRKAANRVRAWDRSMAAPQLREACFNAFMFIDAAGGTGGGIFRYMYGRFLREAAVITGDRRLEQVSDEFQHLGDRWQEAAELFKGASSAERPAASLADTGGLIRALADLEEAAWTRLREIASE